MLGLTEKSRKSIIYTGAGTNPPFAPDARPDTNPLTAPNVKPKDLRSPAPDPSRITGLISADINTCFYVKFR